MANSLSVALPYLVLGSHAVLALLFLSLVFRRSWGKAVALWFGKHALVLAFLASITAVLGSLFYSEVVGYEPCVLCWWQRAFLYPMPILFGLALWKKRKSAFFYATPLAAIASVISLYQSYVYWGGKSLLPCTAAEGECSKIYVMEFGYITIPTMALTIALFILVLAWAYRTYQKENENSNA